MDNTSSKKRTITNNTEQDLCLLSAEAFEAFQLAINTDPQIIPEIAALLTHKAPWDND
ncbi:MAG: hypothetical protein Q7S87_02910 [Agitococcus sp.]|nr:hypothetical protein [Agitococcus sp.]